MRSNLFFRLADVLAAAMVSGLLFAQVQPAAPHVVSVEPPPAVTARRGGEVEIRSQLRIRSGYHINSQTPAEDYLIPTLLSWDSGPLTLRSVAYPKPATVRYEFASQPMLVYSGVVTVISRLAVAADAPPGAYTLTGKLRYQACTDKACLLPRTLPVSVPLTIE